MSILGCKVTPGSVQLLHCPKKKKLSESPQKNRTSHARLGQMLQSCLSIKESCCKAACLLEKAVAKLPVYWGKLLQSCLTIDKSCCKAACLLRKAVAKLPAYWGQLLQIYLTVSGCESWRCCSSPPAWMRWPPGSRSWTASRLPLGPSHTALLPGSSRWDHIRAD